MTRWRLTWVWITSRPLVADSLLAVGLFLLSPGLVVLLPREVWPEDLAGAVIWSAIGSVPIAIRRRWPWIAVLAMAGYSELLVVAGVETAGLAILVITYTAAAHLSVRESGLALAMLWLPALITSTALGRFTEQPMQLSPLAFVLFNTMMALVAFLAGRIAFTRRRYVLALVERARTAERTQVALAERAVADERRRIARELHDVVAHHVSVLAVLATGSRRALRSDPDAADEALATIEETSRTTLRELRRLLDVLRTDPEPAGELEPQPGLARLENLIDQVREAGLDVALRLTPTGQPLEPGLALTVYRIVQEALTNVLKHAGPLATAEVRLDIAPYHLILEIFDTGRGPIGGTIRAGHGLVGMRERVALYGGTLRTGPRPGGGYRVYARIPIEEDSA